MSLNDHHDGTKDVFNSTSGKKSTKERRMMTPRKEKIGGYRADNGLCCLPTKRKGRIGVSPTGGRGSPFIKGKESSGCLLSHPSPGRMAEGGVICGFHFPPSPQQPCHHGGGDAVTTNPNQR